MTSYLISVFLSIYDVLEINMFSCMKIIINKLASDKPDMTQPKRIQAKFYTNYLKF